MTADIGLLVLRVVVGGIVMQHGLLKLGWVGKGGSIAGVAGWFNGIGLRPGLLWGCDWVRYPCQRRSAGSRGCRP